MYYFSSLALTLNEPEEGVAPTDSRRRPDQRLMEQGMWDEANAEKQRLEEKQRSVRREREREAVRLASTAEEGKWVETKEIFGHGPRCGHIFYGVLTSRLKPSLCWFVLSFSVVKFVFVLYVYTICSKVCGHLTVTPE